MKSELRLSNERVIDIDALWTEIVCSAWSVWPVSGETKSRVDRALAYIENGDGALALDALLAAWRSCRCPELAAVVEELGRAAGRPFSGPSGIKGWHSAWIDRARVQDPLDLTALLDALVERAEPRHTSIVSSCLSELSWASDDPRATGVLLRLLEVRGGSSSWNKVHTRLFALLEATSDPRAIAGLAPAIERSSQASPEWSPSMQASLARAKKVKAKLCNLFSDGVPTLPPEAAVACAAISMRAKQPLEIAPPAPRKVADGQALLEAIWRDPEDDAARQVYADWLMEKGDVRGELIALQLLVSEPEAKKKAKRLIEKNRRTLLGPLAKAVMASTAVFERGFLVACETDVRRKVEADVIFGRPEWATVERIVFHSYAGLSAHMRALVEARGVTEAALAALATVELPRLEVLAFCGNASRGAGDSLAKGIPGEGLRALGATRGLPRLRKVEIGLTPREFRDGRFVERGAGDFEWLLAAPFAHQLEELRVQVDLGHPTALRSWLDVLATHPTLRRISSETGSAELVVEKHGKKMSAHLSFPRHGTELAAPPPWMTRTIGQIREAFPELEIELRRE